MSEAQPRFEIALSLTAEGDYHGVSVQLLHAVRALEFVLNAEIYEVYSKEGDHVRHSSNLDNLVIRHFSRLLQSERTVLDEFGLLETIEQGDVVTLQGPDEKNPMTRLIFPISDNIGPMRLLVIDGTEQIVQHRSYLDQLAQLYHNLVQVHDSRERDLLTGLQNRQTFDDNMLKIMTHLRELKDSPKRSMAWLAVLDIDHFKRINDNFGHLYGDEVLLRFAQLIKKWFRSSDLAFRFGGEEFIVLMVKASTEGAEAGLERFRQAVEQHDFGKAGRVTVSIGFVPLNCKTLPSTLIDRADQALYQAKQSGRNRIVQFAKEAQPATEDDIELFD